MSPQLAWHVRSCPSVLSRLVGLGESSGHRVLSFAIQNNLALLLIYYWGNRSFSIIFFNVLNTFNSASQWLMIESMNHSHVLSNMQIKLEENNANLLQHTFSEVNSISSKSFLDQVLTVCFRERAGLFVVTFFSCSLIGSQMRFFCQTFLGHETKYHRSGTWHEDWRV